MLPVYNGIRIVAQEQVYEPGDDSFLLAAAVEKYAFGKVLDMGTGSGIQGIVAAKKGLHVTFADVDDAAIECAKANAKANKIQGRFTRSDLFENIDEKFNTVIFNPPYLPSKGITGAKGADRALDGGKSGREVIDRFLRQCRDHVLERHVVLLLESSFNSYGNDVKGLHAEIVGKEHYFFEDLVVLKFSFPKHSKE